MIRGKARLGGGKPHLKRGIRWIGALQIPILMFYNAVSTAWNNRFGSAATKNQMMKRLRNPCTKIVWYNLGIVDETNCTFRTSFSTLSTPEVFKTFLRESDKWPTKDAFVDIYYSEVS